eukprot:8969293-Alexandrium_andersonii.AAC.1
MLRSHVLKHELPGPIRVVCPAKRPRAPELPLLGRLGLQLGIALRRQQRPRLLGRRQTLAD